MPFVNAGGHRLDYVWIGPGPDDTPTLVFLHEGLGSIAMWRDFPAKVAEATGLGTLVYSRYGYGKSDVLKESRKVEYMHDEAFVALPEVLNALGVKAPILIGHSDGGSIALLYGGSVAARRAGKGVDGPAPLALITMAAHVFVEQLSVDSIAGAKTAYETTDLPKRLGRYHDDVDKTFWGWNDIWLLPAFFHWNIEAYLPTIACPVLAMQGEDDEYGTVKQVEAIRDKTGGPVTVCMLPKCKHSPHRDQPALTLDAMKGFISRVTHKVAAQ
ncbi:MAG: alpha/beta fold hydrolase [Candidatus Eiseniibacteriota bacterium]